MYTSQFRGLLLGIDHNSKLPSVTFVFEPGSTALNTIDAPDPPGQSGSPDGSTDGRRVVVGRQVRSVPWRVA
jgi:hypothetical protein